MSPSLPQNGPESKLCAIAGFGRTPFEMIGGDVAKDALYPVGHSLPGRIKHSAGREEDEKGVCGNRVMDIRD